MVTKPTLYYSNAIQTPFTHLYGKLGCTHNAPLSSTLTVLRFLCRQNKRMEFADSPSKTILKQFFIINFTTKLQIAPAKSLKNFWNVSENILVE